MNVLIATGLYAPEIGGPATYTALLEEHLPQHGHTVVVVPFRVSRSLPKLVRHLHYAYRVFRAAATADIIFAQDVASVGLPARVAAWLRRVPFWVRVPGDYAWEQATQRYGVTDDIDTFQQKKYGFRVQWLRTVQRFVTKTATQVVTPSNYFKELVTGWGVDPEKIVTIYNGVDLNITPAPVPPLTRPTIVSAGRLVPWKGFAMLIHAMTELPEWQLVILGDGPDRLQLEAMANTYGVSDRVQFTGQVPRDVLCGWIAAADVFALNTSFESFSYQVVEAMAMGTPVIITDVGSLPELVGDADVGRVLSVDDQAAFVQTVKEVAAQPERWQQRGVQAAARAQQFKISSTVAAIDELLCQVAT